jgi:hypothetical protein
MFGRCTPCIDTYPSQRIVMIRVPTTNMVPLQRLFLPPSRFTRTQRDCTMTTLERAASIHGGCDRHWSYGKMDHLVTEDTIPRKSRDLPLHTEAAIETMETRSDGSEFSFSTRQSTPQKKLNRWQAALIYITNQAGVGILGLPSVMQTLGLIPGIICVIGLGMPGHNRHQLHR